MRQVPHIRPEMSDTIRAGSTVGGYDWGGYAALANFSLGHGGMLVPWCAIGQTVSSGATNVYHFYVAPKGAAVERVWVINARASAAIGVTMTIAVDGAAVGGAVALSSYRDSRYIPAVFRQSLSAKTSTAADTYLSITAAGGDLVVESVACYEQTRAELSAATTDYGTDIVTLQARQPIVDLGYKSIAGVCDAYKNLDARRSGFFHWSTNTASALAITAGSGSPSVLFPFAITVQGAIPTLGDTQTSLTCAVYGKVNAGTGTVRFTSTQAADSANVDITATSYAWVTKTLLVETEDLTAADGRRTGWEDIVVDAWVTATNQLDIQAISIVRVTAPI